MSRFIIKRNEKKKLLDINKPAIKKAIKKIISQENKVLAQVKKRAKENKIELSEIHHQLTLYAMRTHARNIIREVLKNNSVP